MNKRGLNFGIFGGKKQREESDASEFVSELDQSVVSTPNHSVKIPASSLRSSSPMMKDGMATVEFSSLSNNNKAVIGVAENSESVIKPITEVEIESNGTGVSVPVQNEVTDNQAVIGVAETGGSVPVQIDTPEPISSDISNSGSIPVNIEASESTSDTNEPELQSDGTAKDAVDVQTEDSNQEDSNISAEVPESDTTDNSGSVPLQVDTEEDGVDESTMPTVDDLFSTFEGIPEGLRRALVERVMYNYPELFDNGVSDVCMTFEDEETPQDDTVDSEYTGDTLTDMFCSSPILDRKELLLNMFSQFDDLLNYLRTYDTEIHKQLSELKEQRSILVDHISDDTTDEDLAKTTSDIRDIMRSIKEVESMKGTVKELVDKYSK